MDAPITIWHFRADAVDLARTAAESGDEQGAHAWLQVSKLDDEAVSRLITTGAAQRGWGAGECLAFVAERQVVSKSRPAAIRRGPGAKTRALQDAILAILDSFDGSMSTRQVFYQCVSRGVVVNNEAGYDRVQRLLVNMRRDGLVPYGRMVDRNRSKHHREGWGSVEEGISSLYAQYRRDCWAEQRSVVMVGCEKLALEGIFAEVADEYGASLWTVVGFTSLSFAFDWAEEIKRLTNVGKHVVIAFFGDHDPSGLVIEKKIQDELRSHGAVFSWKRCGLLWEDFDRFGLINVPVKPGDSRTRGYLEQFGNRAAELDALPPGELRSRIRNVIAEHVDAERWRAIRNEEELNRESLRVVSSNWAAAVAGARSAA